MKNFLAYLKPAHKWGAPPGYAPLGSAQSRRSARLLHNAPHGETARSQAARTQARGNYSVDYKEFLFAQALLICNRSQRNPHWLQCPFGWIKRPRSAVITA